MSDNGKSKLSSTFGMYLTLLGFSWGMSDMWRFPFLAYRNGGGAFLIPFVLTVLLCGIPMYFLEFGVGKFSGKGPYRVWDIAPLLRGTGVTIFLAYSAYIFVSTIFRGWIFQFTFYCFQDPLPWTTCHNAWNTATCRESGLRLLATSDDVIGDVDFANVTLATSNGSDWSATWNTTLHSVIANDSIGMAGRGMTAEEEFWKYNIVGLSSGLTDLYPFQWKYAAFTFAWRAVIACIVIFGIQAIEKVMYVSATVPILCSLAVLVRSLMLPGAGDGLYLFFYPDMDKLRDIRIWIEAFVMAFYTLAFGWGCLIMLGSHTKFKESSVRVAILCPILDAAMAIFQGTVCFSVLGNMAAAHGQKVEDVIEANISTGVIALMSALATLPLPQLWSLLFIISFILSSLDSQLVPFEMIAEVLGEMFPRLQSKNRLCVILGLSLVTFLLGLPTCTGAGPYVFLLLDWYAGAWSGPIAAIVEVVTVAWIYGLDRLSDDVRIMTGKPLPWLIHIGIAFIAPIFLATIFIVSILEYIPPMYGAYTYPIWARLVGWLLVTVIVSPILLVAVAQVCSQQGPIVKRIKRLLRPSTEWGPADDASSSKYDEVVHKYESRPYTELLFFNLTRRYRRFAYDDNANTAREMKTLV